LKQSQYSTLPLTRADDAITESSIPIACPPVGNGDTDSLSSNVTSCDLAKVASIFTRYPKLASSLGYNEESYRRHDFRGISQVRDMFERYSNSVQIVFKISPLSHDHTFTDCHVTLSLRDRSFPIKVSAAGRKKAKVRDIAMLKLLLKLDEEQLLEQALGMPSKVKTAVPNQQEPQAQNAVIPSSTSAVPPEFLEQLESVTVTGDTAGSVLGAVSSESAGNVPEKSSSQSQATVQVSGHHVTQLLTRKQANKEENAIFDVYSLAAKFSLDVEHTFEIPHDNGTANKTYRIEINLHDHDLKIVAIGDDPRVVESSAFLAFKQKALKKGILDKAPVSSSSQHPVVLNTLVATNFMDFYKDYYNPKLRLITRAYPDKVLEARFISEPKPFECDKPFRKVGGHNLECLISLATARQLVKKQPELWEEYIEKLEPLSHRYTAKARPVALNLTQSSLMLMRQAIEAAQDAGLTSLLPVEQQTEEHIPRSMRPLPPEVSNRRSRELLKWYHESLQSGPRQTQDIPMIDYKAEVLETIEKNVYSFIVGQTGSGKTTQVPQILLDHYIQNGRGGDCRIICTRKYFVRSIGDVLY
jgi:hypothetical protein